jgi:folate-binding protein YgfZ
MDAKIVRLTTRSLIRITGEEAGPWLSSLITQNTEALAPGAMVHGALLTPQGRLICDFFVKGLGEEGLLLDIEAGEAEALIRRLSLYRLRAKVSVAPQAGEVVVAFGGETPEGFTPDPRLEALGGRRIVLEGETSPQETAGLADYVRFRRTLGVGESLADGLADRVYPVEANFDLLNGIDFHKGCFVGQETTSRMKRRGQVKSRVLPIFCDAGEVQPGEVLNGDLRAGELFALEGGVGLGLMRLDRIDGALSIAGTPVRVQRPDWMAPASP